MTMQLTTLVEYSQKWQSWLISHIFTFENHKTSLVCELYKELIHSKHILQNNLLPTPFHLLLYGYIDLLSKLILSCNNEYLNQLYK